MKLIPPGERRLWKQTVDEFAAAVEIWQNTPRNQRGPRPQKPTKPTPFTVVEVDEPTEVVTPDGPAIAMVGTLVLTRGDEVRVVHKQDANQEGLWAQD